MTVDGPSRTDTSFVDAHAIRDLPVPQLPAPLRLLNRRNAASTRTFTKAEVLDAVADKVGSAMHFDDEVHEALEAFCTSVHEDSNLHFFGSNYAQNLVTIALVTRARFEKFYAANPEIEATELIPPVIVCGLQRSGTTFLHRLLAEADNTRALALWELLDPVPPTEGRDLRKVTMGATFHAFRFAAPDALDALHYMRPTLPDECQFLLRLNLRSPVLFTALATFGYADFLFETDMTRTYELYRRILKTFQYFAPGRRLTLKNPGHSLHLREMLDVLPDAHIVQTHRDPLDTVPSQCTLAFTAQSAMTNGVPPEKVIGATVRMQQLMAERSLAVRETPAGAAIMDVDYRSLVADPVGTVEAIHSRFDLPYSPALAHALDTHRRENRQHRHGTYSYSIEQFGLNHEKLAERFGTYRDAFLT